MLVRTFVLVVATLFSACSAELDADPQLLSGPLTIDSEFSLQQRQDILRAIELWQRATDARFAPEVHIAEVSCGQPFAIEAVPSDGCHVGQEVHDEDAAADEHDEGEQHRQRVLGSAHPVQHWISVVTWLEGADFRNNVAHELGHYLQLGHGAGIMAQARKHEPAVVAPTSIREFCSIWGCGADASEAAD